MPRNNILLKRLATPKRVYQKVQGLEELTREKSSQELNKNQDEIEIRKSVVEWQLMISFLQLLV